MTQLIAVPDFNSTILYDPTFKTSTDRALSDSHLEIVFNLVTQQCIVQQLYLKCVADFNKTAYLPHKTRKWNITTAACVRRQDDLLPQSNINQPCMRSDGAGRRAWRHRQFGWMNVARVCYLFFPQSAPQCWEPDRGADAICRRSPETNVHDNWDA